MPQLIAATGGGQRLMMATDGAYYTVHEPYVSAHSYTILGPGAQTAATGSSNNVIWGAWNQQQFAYTTGSSATTVWQQWLNQQAGSQTIQVTVQATQAAIQAATGGGDLRRAKCEANDRAAALLSSMLSAQQRQQYEREQAFEIVTCRSGATRRYKLKHGWAGNIFLLDDKGREVERFCIHPEIAVPEADNLVAQKLLLESDESTFLRTANRSVLRGSSWIPASRAA